MLVVGMGLLILGAGLELAQTALPSRSGSAYDALANLVGIAFGTVAAARAKTLEQKRARTIAYIWVACRIHPSRPIPS